MTDDRHSDRRPSRGFPTDACWLNLVAELATVQSASIPPARPPRSRLKWSEFTRVLHSDEPVAMETPPRLLNGLIRHTWKIAQHFLYKCSFSPLTCVLQPLSQYWLAIKWWTQSTFNWSYARKFFVPFSEWAVKPIASAEMSLPPFHSWFFLRPLRRKED